MELLLLTLIMTQYSKNLEKYKNDLEVEEMAKVNKDIKRAQEIL